MIIVAIGVAYASPEPLGGALGGGAVVDWTGPFIEATAKGRTDAAANWGIAEELARRGVERAIREDAPALRIDCGVTLTSLLDGSQVGQAIATRLSRWEIEETRYGTSGQVEVAGRLDLMALLKPYTLARATPVTEVPASQFTGLVVDARSVGARPQWMPRLVAPDGGVLHDGVLFDDLALELAPALWVEDLIDPRVPKRVGTNPLVVTATASTGCALQVSADDAERIRAEAGTDLLRRGHLVVAVSAP